MSMGPSAMQQHLQLLGQRAKDRVTGYEGIIQTIGFDLYGCIQADISGGLDDKGQVISGRWFDVSRLKILDTKPVMIQPNFVEGPIAEGKQGAADKSPRDVQSVP